MRTKANVLLRLNLLFLSCFLLLFGCGRKSVYSGDILEELMASCGSLPRGEIYCSDAEEGGAGYAPSALLRAMYGEEGEEAIRFCEFSLYVSSFAQPYEIAVLAAPSSDHARRVYALCLSRLDDLKVALRNTDYEGLSQNALVYRRGRYVVMGLTQDRDSFLHAVKRALG